MARLLILLFVLSALAFAVVTVWLALSSVRAKDTDQPRKPTQGDSLPDTFKTIAYILLIVLMLGVTTGWLAGL